MDLREGGRSGGGVRDRLRNALITAEVAIALTLLIGSGLLIRTSIAMQRIDPGFDPRGTLMARLSLPEVTYKEPSHIIQTLTRLTQALAQMPGVSSAAVTSQAPMGPGGGSNGLIVEGSSPTPDHLVDARLRLITPGYLTLMGIPLKRGRIFNDRDVGGNERVMILSEATARRLWPGADPIGKRVLCCEGSETDPRTKTVVGVVGGVRSAGLSAPVDPEFYLPIAQTPPEAWNWIQRSVTLVVKGTAGDPAALVGVARAAVREIDPVIPLDRVSTMSQAIETSLAPARFNTILLSTLGAIGLILAAVGIYGVVSYFVSVRIREIGLRVALGASRADILRLMTWQGVRPIVAGVALGAVGALGATRALESALVGVGARDPFTFVGVAAVLLLVGTAASLVPARRALKVQPTRALQE
jgi:putative ABC transport system permease protein